jgi:3-dehydroquinate synthase
VTLPVIQYSLNNHQHTIVVGDSILNTFNDWITKTLGNRRYVLVCELASKQYANYLTPYHTIIIQGGEHCKSWKSLQNLCENLIPHIDRSTVLVALGDLVGFASSILLRGLDWVFIPTTLLSQVDSSIGGKTAINSKHGKNLIGTFNPAKLVISDSSVLQSLNKRQILSGYVELFKHALIADENLFLTLEKLKPNDFENISTLAPFIHRSIQLKLQIINQDWFEKQQQGDRIHLNLGHTFGHAFEYLQKPKLLHGEAVAMGTIISYKIASHLGICLNSYVERIESHFQQLKIKTCPQDLLNKFSSTVILEKIMLDKKKQDNSIKFVLPKGIGKGCEVHHLNTTQLEEFLRILK